MAGPSIFFEDFAAGDEKSFAPVTVTREDILDFAREWDPQPMHTDEAAAEAGILGGLSASGWHTCCVMMRRMCDEFLLDSSSMGAPGIEELRWLKPVRPGDTLTVHSTVLETRVSGRRPDMGIVRCRYEMTNQHGETVMSLTFPAMFGRRAAAS